MEIRLSVTNDIEILSQHDRHINKTELENLIRLNRDNDGCMGAAL